MVNILKEFNGISFFNESEWLENTFIVLYTNCSGKEISVMAVI